MKNDTSDNRDAGPKTFILHPSTLILQFKSRWFVICLLSLITTGLLLGYFLDAELIESFRSLVPSRVLTAFIVFMMSFSLDSRQLKSSFKAPAPVVWACVCNFGLIPLLALPLMNLQQTPDFRIGLMIAASVPCTLAGASVWTRRAGGNDAVSLLTTLLTNTACFVLTPLWLQLGTGHEVPLEMVDLTWRLLFVVLLPILLGQLVRRPAAAAEFAKTNKTQIGVAAQSCILFLVFSSACLGGVQLKSSGISTQVIAIGVVWLSCIGLHLIAMAVAWTGGGLFRFDRRDRIAASIAGSQKTLPIGVYLATDLQTFGGSAVVDGMPVPFAVFPILMFHASQLFIDTIIADRMARGDRSEPEEPCKS